MFTPCFGFRSPQRGARRSYTMPCILTAPVVTLACLSSYIACLSSLLLLPTSTSISLSSNPFPSLVLLTPGHSTLRHWAHHAVRKGRFPSKAGSCANNLGGRQEQHKGAIAPPLPAWLFYQLAPCHSVLCCALSTAQIFADISPLLLTQQKLCLCIYEYDASRVCHPPLRTKRCTSCMI